MSSTSIDLYVSDRGTGEPALVFLHYYAASSRAWNGVVGLLESQNRCIAPDLRGFGDSSAPASGYAVRDYTDDVANLVRSLGMDRYVLIGHSMGGKFAMALAARRPPGLGALVLVDPSPPTPEPIPEPQRLHLLASHGDRLAMEDVIRSAAVTPLPKAIFQTAVEDNLRSSPAAWRAWLELGSRENIASEMPNICVPTVVLRGAEDPIMSKALLEREVVGRITGSHMIEVAGSGHLPPLGDPHAVATLVRQVVDSLHSQSAS